MPIKVGEDVQSTMAPDLAGTVVGYGSLRWTVNIDGAGGDPEAVPVYLVMIRAGSSSLGPACVVMRADRVRRVPDQALVPARAEIGVTLALPVDLEQALAGGPKGDADNMAAYLRLEEMIERGEVRLTDVKVDSLEP